MCSEQTTEDELWRHRYDYAMRWFEYHAGQRVSMLNFFIVAAGILAAAMGTFIEASKVEFAFWSSVIGALVSVCFFLLDRRNRQLVALSEKVLLAIEKSWLFTDEKAEYLTYNNDDESLPPVGILRPDSWACGFPHVASPFPQWMLSHTRLIGGVELLVCTGFLVAAWKLCPYGT